MFFRKINALEILIVRADENDERNTSWLLIHVVVWEIFELIGLCVGIFVFNSLVILN